MRVAAEIALSKEEHRMLERRVATRSTSVRLRDRVRMVLMAAEGVTNKATTEGLGVDAGRVDSSGNRELKSGVARWSRET